MKTIIKILTISFFAVSLSMSIATSVQAGDDTDIYFPVESSESSQNVLFIMDVSGSMSREVGNTGGSRYQAMKSAFNSILQTTPEGINVGLMNFGSIGSDRTNYAQGVKFPISPLTASARNIIEDGLPLNNDGSVNWNANNIPDPVGAVTVFDFLPQVVESWSPQGYTPLVGSLYEAGLYFRGEKVGWGSGPLEENGNEWVAHPSTYTGASGGWDPTACATVWTERLPQDVIPAEYRCPADVNNPGASAGTYANCAATATDCIAAPGGGGNTGSTTTLDIQVNSGSDDAEENSSGGMYLDSSDLELVRDDTNQTVGIRFNGVNVPKNATVTNAYIQFEVDETSSESTQLTIRGQDSDNALTFNNNNSNISIRPLTTATTYWNPASWPTSSAQGADQRTPDLSAIIEEIVDRAGWNSGQSMAFVITGSGKRYAESYDGESDAAPILHIEYSTDSTTENSDTQETWQGYWVENEWNNSTGRHWDDQPGNNPVYTFTVTEESWVEVYLEAWNGDSDTFLWLVYPDGTHIYDDDSGADGYGTASWLGRTLPPGEYTVYAATYHSGVDADMGLWVEGHISKLVKESDGYEDRAISGGWTNGGGQNATSDDNQRYYFNITQAGTVEITLDEQGSVDPYLYLLDEAGTILEEDNDGGWRNDGSSRIEKNLAPGIYQIVAATTNATSGNSADFSIHLKGQHIDEFPYSGPASPSNSYPEARYVKLVAESEVNGGPWTSIAEISLIDDADVEISKGGWSATVDSEELTGEGSGNGHGLHAIDGDTGTFWHTQWQATDPDPAHNHQIVIDMGANHNLKEFHYLPRQAGANGRIGNYKIYISTDNSSWTEVFSGAFTNTSTNQILAFSENSPGGGNGNGNGNGNNVVMCHVPENNPDNAHTIIIPAIEQPLHEAHGDLPGACGTGISSAGSVQGTCLYTMCAGAAVSEPTYITPIKNACQSNTIILLSDGSPQAEEAVDINATYDKVVTNDEWTSPLADAFRGLSCTDTPGLPRGKCGPELTSFLATNDNSSDLDGNQFVQTYTVGLGLGQNSNAENYLKSLATVDDPTTPGVTEGYFSASNQATLITAFGTILSELQEVEETTTSFSNPGYSIVSRTGLNHEDTLFVPVFEVSDNVVWKGNLKKFKTVNVSGRRLIQGKEDANGVRHNAVTNEGALTEEAHDLWSTSATPEGREVAAGGAAALLNPASRNLYSDLNCTSGSSCDLYSTNNQLSISNMSEIGVTELDLNNGNENASLNYRKDLICFIRGYQSFDTNTNVCTGTARKHMGDMLHFAPVGVTYHYDHLDGDDDTHRQVIFAGTNEGYLHAIDTETGEEIFAFMPKELLKNIKPQFDDNEHRGHRFGIDGIATVWITDHNNNGIIESAIAATGSTPAYPADKVYLYFGLRRGGNSYYALDVTDPTQPKLKWKIEGGGNGNFQHLGQSWSRPYLALLNKETTEAGNTTTEQIEVVIFSGGYDAVNQDQDLADRDAADSVGNDIFIVNANTGEFIWSIKKGTTGSENITGSSLLTHSIPGGARIIDMDRDGTIDRMYFADVTGKVWRLELENDLDQSRLVPLADLGEGSSGVEPRKFFNEPDVSLTRKGGNTSLLVSIGSGDRTKPLDKTSTDRFYVLIDRDIHSDRSANNKIENSDLAAIEMGNNEEGDITLSDPLSGRSVLDPDGDTNAANDKQGWYLEFRGGGEKVIADSLTNHGKVIFNTLVPDIYANAAPTINACNVPAIQGRAYILDILTGKAAFDFNGSGGNPDNDDLYSVISANEIPGGVQLIFNEPKAADGSVCTEDDCVQNVDLRTGKKLSQIMSYNAGVLESVYWTKPQEK